jgi:hypothetical protein
MSTSCPGVQRDEWNLSHPKNEVIMSERTTRHPSGSRKEPSGSERRAWVRYECESDVAFQPLVDRKAGTWHAARVRNISAKGMGVVLEVPIQRGAILSVKLEGTAKRFSQPLLVRVVRVAARSGGIWHVGCTFAIPLGEQELRGLTGADNALPAPPDKKQQPPPARGGQPKSDTHDPFLHGSAKERRGVHRRRITISVLLFYGSGFENSEEALAVDASLGGLKLLARQPFGRGSILRVRGTKAPQRIPSVDVRVKSCRPQESMWVIGAQFVQPPSSDIIMYFG